MSWQVQNITADAYQVHRLLFQDSVIALTLRFHPTLQIWTFDAAYKGWQVNGQKLSVAVLHIRSQNMPFDFWVVDNSGMDLDPFQASDFSSGRCSLSLLEAADMQLIRGAPVPV